MPILTPEDVVNAAATRVGLEPIESLDEESLGAQAGKNAYNGVVGFMLSVYPFSWALETKLLARLEEESLLGRRFVHQLPPEALGPPVRYLGHRVAYPVKDALIEGGRVHSDAEILRATIMTMPEPARWSHGFREAATLGIAAELALSITSDRQLWAELRHAAFGPPSVFPRGGAMGAALAADAHATPALRLSLGDGGFLTGR